MREQRDQLETLVAQHGSKTHSDYDYAHHFAYVDSITNSLLILSKDPHENTVALVSLLRLILESTATLKEVLHEGAEQASAVRQKFIKSYRNPSNNRPADLLYSKLVQNLSHDSEEQEILKKLYRECSKTIHFSRKSLDVIQDSENSLKAIAWSCTLLTLLGDSFKQTHDTILKRAKIQ